MIMFFILSVPRSTPLLLQVMDGAKRLHNIFECGREIEKVGNN